MKNEEKLAPAAPLTLAVLEELQSRGFKYVIVNAFAHDNRPDYMEPHYFVLQPVKQLPEDVNQKGIYEPIESPLLREWAESAHEGTRIFVKMR
jgi:hypothetical protein